MIIEPLSGIALKHKLHTLRALLNGIYYSLGVAKDELRGTGWDELCDALDHAQAIVGVTHKVIVSKLTDESTK